MITSTDADKALHKIQHILMFGGDKNIVILNNLQHNKGHILQIYSYHHTHW